MKDRNIMKVCVVIMFMSVFALLPESFQNKILQKNILTVYASDWGDYTYEVLEDGTIEITGYFGAETKLEIPSVIYGRAVTSISRDAFWYTAKSLTEIILSENIVNIEGELHETFMGYDNLTRIEVNPNNRVFASINGILYNKAKTVLLVCPPGKNGNIAVPSGVKDITDTSFLNCRNITSITIPSSVTNIEYTSIQNCTNLTAIEVDKNNKVYVSDDGVLYNKAKTKLIKCPARKKSISIPSSVTSIGDGAFMNCNSLTDILIPASVTKIGMYVFFMCDNPLISCEPGSVAELYAIENNIKYEYIKIVSLSNTSIRLSSTQYSYTGSAVKPNVTITYGSRILNPGIDYSVSYKNNTHIGTATITITGKNYYTGTVTKTFNIVPGRVTSLKQSTQNYSSTAIQMSWSKVPGAAGYMVYRSDSKDGTYKLLKTVTTNSFKNSYLKSGSKFYYKVRAYKTVNGKKIYGGYSDIKSMLTKPAMPTI